MGWVRSGVGLGGGVRVDVNGEVKFLGKSKKKNIFFFVGGVWGGQDGCEQRIEVFVKIQKRNLGGGGSGLGGQGRCERIEVFVKIQNEMGGRVGVGWGRVSGGSG